MNRSALNTTEDFFDLNLVHPSWRQCIQSGLTHIDPLYLGELQQANWLPGKDKIFSAFSLPLEKVNYVLIGESPYPRSESANGYAFWDASVNELWSETGLSKKVNRATSLRNIIKMLLVAEGLLQQQCSQAEIAKIDKTSLVKTNTELFFNFLDRGFLLLNATPVLWGAARKDMKAWIPFLAQVLNCIQKERPQATFILLGNIAISIERLIFEITSPKIYAEHPYNLSFVHNPTILQFFKPLHLLRSEKYPLKNQSL